MIDYWYCSLSHLNRLEPPGTHGFAGGSSQDWMAAERFDTDYDSVLSHKDSKDDFSVGNAIGSRWVDRFDLDYEMGD